MNCSEFKALHNEFLDEMLSGVDLVRAQLHLAECKRCSDLDAAVRRALLVFRNLPPIEPSRHFSRRLNSRLVAERTPAAIPLSDMRAPIAGAFALAAGLMLMAVLAGSSADQSTPSHPPVVAQHTQSDVAEVVGPAIAATVSAGLPAWPAVFMIERASEQLANAEFRFTNYSPR
jgi:hypothetical protein